MRHVAHMRYTGGMDDLVTTAQAAEIIGCSPQHVRRLALAGTLPGRAVTPRMWLFERRAVRAIADTAQSQGWPRGKSRKPEPRA